MLKTINKNILDVEQGIICHQVNCQGVMGSGLAKQIRAKWPQVYTDYRIVCDNGLIGVKFLKETLERIYEHQIDSSLLGKVISTRIAKNLKVSNLFAQDKYGRDKRYTDYEAFENCLIYLKKLNDWHKKIAENNKWEFVPQQYYFPYKIGCGLGGGDWSIVEPLIEKYLPNAIICKYEN